MKKNLFYAFIPLLFWGCNSDEYSPNQIFNRNTAKNVNAREIASLPQKPAGSTIRIALSGDTQRSYKESQDFVNLINQRNDIDFIILNGDISDFGLLLEFDGIYKIYDGLKIPFISIIGNHDLIANGSEIYKRMFGPLNFTFNYAGVKFICHDTNGREYNFNGTTPDLNWLKNNLNVETGINNTVAISHISPFDDDFDPKIQEPYKDLFQQANGLLASIHSHRHGELLIDRRNGTGIPYIICGPIVKRVYTIIEIKNGQITAEEIKF